VPAEAHSTRLLWAAQSLHQFRLSQAGGACAAARFVAANRCGTGAPRFKRGEVLLVLLAPTTGRKYLGSSAGITQLGGCL